jgi:hypothetical protein
MGVSQSPLVTIIQCCAKSTPTATPEGSLTSLKPQLTNLIISFRDELAGVGVISVSRQRWVGDHHGFQVKAPISNKDEGVCLTTDDWSCAAKNFTWKNRRCTWSINEALKFTMLWNRIRERIVERFAGQAVCPSTCQLNLQQYARTRERRAAVWMGKERKPTLCMENAVSRFAGLTEHVPAASTL